MKDTVKGLEIPIEALQSADIQKICQTYLKNDCRPRRKCLKAKDSEEQPANSEPAFEIKGFEMRPISEGPAGFLGRHNFMTVEIQLGGDQHQLLHFFTKSAPVEIASRMEYLEEFGVFRKEISVYRDILPKIERIFPQIGPKCYYAHDNILIFENLTHLGYRMAGQRSGLLDFEHLCCALKSLAALHAGSFCWEAKQGKKLVDVYPETFVENAYPLNVPETNLRVQNFRQAVEVFKAILQTLPQYQQDLDFILAELPVKMERVFEMSKASTKYRNVFSHGDLWSNNLMFAYSSESNLPVQCRLLDFQLARYAPLQLDLITLLTIPTSRKFRQLHLHALIKRYYKFLAEFLARESLNIEKIVPEKEFLASIEEFRMYGLIESCLFSHLTVLPSRAAQELTATTDGFKDFFDRKRVDICMSAFKTDKVYRERLSDMLEDFVDNFVLN